MADLLGKRSLWQRIKDIAFTDVTVLARGGVDADTLARIEQTLLESDVGVPLTMRFVEAVRQQAASGRVRTPDDFRVALRDELVSSLQHGSADPSLRTAGAGPTVILVLGVNGAGKTTSIGKLAARYRAAGKRVLLGAGDTFRAGAIDQLRVWAERTGADFVGGQPGADPAAVAFQAIEAGIARGVDVVIIDTAGRLHTSHALMDELRKVYRVVTKRLDGPPHEALLVLDGTVGQNAIQQARQFGEAVPLTGLIVTKLDGTARGGVVVAVHEAVNIPVKFLGVGEQATDLQPFDAVRFVEELLGG